MKRVLVLSLVLGGCVYGRGHRAEEPFDTELEWSHGGEASAAPTAGPSASLDTGSPWWRVFGNAELDRLERMAVDGALDLRAAEARVLRSRALATQAQAARYPSIGLGASASRNRSISPVGGAVDSRIASVSLPISWELDLFARRANEAHAARLGARASEADRDALALSLSAEVADAYFDLLEVRSQRVLLEEDRDADRRTRELVSLRFTRGLSTAVDVEEARQQEVADDAQLSLLGSAETSARLRLAALLGLRPSLLPTAREQALPQAPSSFASEIRANMLTGRPDVRAARLRVSSVDSSVGAAIAARLPTIQLTFTPGYSALHSQSSFGSGSAAGTSYAAAVSLNAPLFDGFLGRGRVDEQRARLLEAEANYERTLIGALVEVESTLALERDERAHHQALRRSVDVAGRLLSAAQDRFRLGLSDFLPVLGALRGRTTARLALLASDRRLLALRVTLHRAVGGPLPDSASPPNPEQEP
ncbi:MAG: TolC family protein [Deltaproteobacteria bacterium]|nr:TolC family protein [Deltaproteobacteria bacterium]